MFYIVRNNRDMRLIKYIVTSLHNQYTVSYFLDLYWNCSIIN